MQVGAEGLRHIGLVLRILCRRYAGLGKRRQLSSKGTQSRAQHWQDESSMLEKSHYHDTRSCSTQCLTMPDVAAFSHSTQNYSNGLKPIASPFPQSPPSCKTPGVGSGFNVIRRLPPKNFCLLPLNNSQTTVFPLPPFKSDITLCPIL